MDKFNGVNRAEITAIRHDCEILATQRVEEPNTTKNKPNNPVHNRNNRRIFTGIRYAVCAIILGVCLLGKFTSVPPFNDASSFIKDELKRDIISEIMDDEKD